MYFFLTWLDIEILIQVDYEHYIITSYTFMKFWYNCGRTKNTSFFFSERKYDIFKDLYRWICLRWDMDMVLDMEFIWVENYPWVLPQDHILVGIYRGCTMTLSIITIIVIIFYIPCALFVFYYLSWYEIHPCVLPTYCMYV